MRAIINILKKCTNMAKDGSMMIRMSWGYDSI
jgi:hypothetical protein